MPEFDPSVAYLPVAGYPGYLAGDDGSVWSCRKPRRGNQVGPQFGNWKQLNPSPDSRGYLVVTLSREDRSRLAMHVHTIVLHAFAGPPRPGEQCRHLNGNPGDNRLGNLIWGTAEENGTDKLRHLQHAIGERNQGAKLTPAQVIAVREMREGGASIPAIAERFGVAVITVSRITRRRSWQHL